MNKLPAGIALDKITFIGPTGGKFVLFCNSRKWTVQNYIEKLEEKTLE